MKFFLNRWIVFLSLGLPAVGMSLIEKELEKGALVELWQSFPLKVLAGQNKAQSPDIAFKHMHAACLKDLQYKCSKNQSNLSKHLVFVLTGRTEPMAKYTETVTDLLHQGFDVLILDHRGQGDSGRLLKDRDASHVEMFQDYAEDAAKVLQRESKGYSKVFGLGVSMGAIVMEHVLFTLQQNKNSIIEKAVLVSPMLGIETSPFPSSLAYGIVNTMTSFGKGESYTIGAEPWIDKIYETTSHSQKRKAIGHSWSVQVKNRRVGGPTNQWVKQAMQAGDRTLARAAKLSLPILLLASEKDSFVEAGLYEPYCKSLQNCILQKMVGSKHEILQEVDAIRSKGLKLIFDFFQN